MSVIEQVWIDNGTASWPPEGWHGLDERDWPRTAEAWEKWDDEGERRRTRLRQSRLRCLHATYVGARRIECTGEGVGTRWARDHGMAEHPGKTVRFGYVHPRWIWEMLGFADLWDGKPRGWYCVLDGQDPRDTAWEADALLLGTRVADHLRPDPLPQAVTTARSEQSGEPEMR